MLSISRLGSIVVLTALASCARQANTGSPPEPATPLAAYLAQRLVVTPTGHVRTADSLGWVLRLGGARGVGRQLDTSIVAALHDRGLDTRWVLPAELARSFERNRSYATDPHQLAIAPLRAASFDVMSRYRDPLASQLRTMVALHEGARFVMLPVELRFEKKGAAGRGMLRVVILDARAAEARWVGEVEGDTSSVPERALANIATRLAELFVAP